MNPFKAIAHWLATPFRAVDSRLLAIARALVDPEARKAAALMLMAGAGMAWTLIVIVVLAMLARYPKYVFWLGAGGWVIVLIVVTGYGAMLYKRSIRISRGGIEIVDADPVTATAAVSTQQEKGN